MVKETPVELHLEKSFDSLRKTAEKLESKMNFTSKESCFRLLDGIHKKINEAHLSRDQEVEYIMLFRFIQVCTKMMNTPNAKSHHGAKAPSLKLYENYANKHMDRLEVLEPFLRQRYIDLESMTSLNTKKSSSSSIYSDMFVDHCENPKQVKAKPRDPYVCGEGGNRYVECSQLYILIKNKSQIKETTLIIDCRSSPDFKLSRLKYDNLIHIPQSVIQRGKSASLLQCALEKEFREKWEKRHSYDRVILVDRDSTLSKIQSNNLLHIVILQEILTQWDTFGIYKCLAVLEGGFDEFENRYPQFTTNPVREISLSNRPNTASDILKHFNYPEVPDMVPKKPPEPLKPIIPSVNRLIKPKTGYSALKEFKEQEKSKDTDDITSSQERGEPNPNTPATADTVQPVEENDEYIDTTVSNPGQESNKFSEPSKTPTYSSKQKEDDGSVTVSKTKLQVSMESSEEEMEQDEPGDGLMNSQQKMDYINRVRKVKPKTSVIHLPINGGVSDNRMDFSSSSSEDEGRVPLKSDGVGSGMKRSLSSPNITKLKDDDMMTPMFSRSNKPNLSVRSQPAPSLLLGENPDAVYGRTQLGLTGLKNFANNCYMNSIVQCLSNTPPLVQELTNFTSKKPAINSNSITKGQIANVFITALHCIWSGDVRIYSIRELKNLMGNYKEIFKGSNHQDSHEFLIILLEYLHDDLNLPREMTVLTGASEETGEKAWGEFRKKNESIIQRLFYGQEQSSVTCTVCRHRSVTFDHFFNLSVPIPDTDRTTLEECIQVYLSGENIIWTCPKCKVDRNAVKKLDITRLPPILIIALKRFSHEVSWLEKKETLVTYPLENLEMRHLTLAGSEQRHTTYNLHALSTHTGTLRAGHYRAICQNYLTNKWYLFDDTSIHSISAQEVRNNPEVYILFYHAVK